MRQALPGKTSTFSGNVLSKIPCYRNETVLVMPVKCIETSYFKTTDIICAKVQSTTPQVLNRRCIQLEECLFRSQKVSI